MTRKSQPSILIIRLRIASLPSATKIRNSSNVEGHPSLERNEESGETAEGYRGENKESLLWSKQTTVRSRRSVATHARLYSTRRCSGEWTKTLPRVLTTAPERSHLFRKRLAVKELTFARAPRCSFVTSTSTP